jgi:hypothetical protein
VHSGRFRRPGPAAFGLGDSTATPLWPEACCAEPPCPAGCAGRASPDTGAAPPAGAPGAGTPGAGAPAAAAVGWPAAAAAGEAGGWPAAGAASAAGGVGDAWPGVGVAVDEAGAAGTPGAPGAAAASGGGAFMNASSSWQRFAGPACACCGGAERRAVRELPDRALERRARQAAPHPPVLAPARRVRVSGRLLPGSAAAEPGAESPAWEPVPSPPRSPAERRHRRRRQRPEPVEGAEGERGGAEPRASVAPVAGAHWSGPTQRATQRREALQEVRLSCSFLHAVPVAAVPFQHASSSFTRSKGQTLAAPPRPGDGLC